MRGIANSLPTAFIDRGRALQKRSVGGGSSAPAMSECRGVAIKVGQRGKPRARHEANANSSPTAAIDRGRVWQQRLIGGGSSALDMKQMQIRRQPRPSIRAGRRKIGRSVVERIRGYNEWNAKASPATPFDASSQPTAASIGANMRLNATPYRASSFGLIIVSAWRGMAPVSLDVILKRYRVGRCGNTQNDRRCWNESGNEERMTMASHTHLLH